MAVANELLLDALDRVAESVPGVLEGLSAEQVAYRPEPSANSIGWLVWHLTRVLDGHIAELDGEPDLWDSWSDRFGLDLPASSTGYGHTPADVAKVYVDPPSLLADYHAAAQERARSFVSMVSDFSVVVDERWDPPVTMGVRLVSVVDDLARHIGQAEYLRGLVLSR
jgi:hypothetical protein